ncbi:hemerythrin domain-containing protein [Streptomyces longwoodensis]|uniref:hemerythrin domain-containing protein n=1 Tax=Streptomyces longwoodensis TaxID=68231 RepID=UPI0034047C02
MPRTIEDQTLEQVGGPGSVLARQRRDHAEMDALMGRHRALPDGEERERVLQQTVQLVFSHAFAEETVLWPAVRRLVEDGEELTSRVEEEHQQINDFVADIERLDPGSPEREDKVRQAFALIRQDIRDEEDLLLPRSRRPCPRTGSAGSARPGTRSAGAPPPTRTRSSRAARPATPCWASRSASTTACATSSAWARRGRRCGRPSPGWPARWWPVWWPVS